MQQQGILDDGTREAAVAQPKPLTLEEIWRACELDQFFPYFQPKVKLRGMELVGVEALMRWRHAERGILSAGAFLPLIADNFLFDELAFIMLEKSVAQCRVWQQQGLDITVSVNMSPDLLQDATLADRIAGIVAEHKVPMHRLIIEVPESAIARESKEALETLIQLRVRGCGIAIDDFGTGYCDRAQIERVPASELKIDRMMLAGAARRPLLRQQLERSVDLARELNLTAVAEGVESQEEWDLINELGVDMVQGYFVAHPMAGDDLKGWLERWSTDPFV